MTSPSIVARLTAAASAAWKAARAHGIWICRYELVEAGPQYQGSTVIECGQFVIHARDRFEADAQAPRRVNELAVVGGEYRYRLRRPTPMERISRGLRELEQQLASKRSEHP